MIVLIGGESHTGKTLMAQKLMEKYRIPYTSIDHIKMGIIRGYESCGFTPEDSDDKICRELWGVIKGIIDTVSENKQNIIIEGCYLPPEKVCKMVSDNVIAFYIVFTKEYIENNFEDIIKYESVIEKRRYPEERGKEEFIKSNMRLKEGCMRFGVQFFEIREDYESEIVQAEKYVCDIINTVNI